MSSRLLWRRVDPAALIALIPAVMVLVAISETRADPDLWGHLRFGRDIVETRSLPSIDPYSFTSDRPWVNHEWLAEVLMHAGYAAGGTAGLVLLKVLVIGGMLALVLRVLNRHQPAPVLRHVIVWLAVYATFTRSSTVRPQVFSLLLFAALLAILTDAERGRRRGLALLPLIMAAWVNLHGGWIVGLGALGVWTVCRLADTVLTARARLEVAGWGLAALAATLVNPYGIGLWQFLYETVGLARPDIADWRPMIRYPLRVMLPWSIMLGLGAWAAVRAAVRPRVASLVIILGLAAATARVNRLDAFFALSVLMLLAEPLVAAWRHAFPKGEPAASVAPGAADRLAVATVSTVVAGVVGLGAAMTFENVRCIVMASEGLPEPQAARFVVENRLSGRMVTWFDWGQYAIWHFHPAVQVSFDGRRETVYSDEMVAMHTSFFRADTDAGGFLERTQADFVWVPRHLPVTKYVAQQGWSSIFEGPISVLWAREAPAGAQPAGDALVPPRCFPGP